MSDNYFYLVARHLNEIAAIGINSMIFAICLRQYFHCKNVIEAVKGAEYYEVGPRLQEIVNNSPNHKVDYIAIKGIVKPIGNSLQLLQDQNINGVIQKLEIKEHLLRRTTLGFWSEQERTVHKVYNTVPFVLKRGFHSVEIIEPLSADILDLDVISHTFEPTKPSMLGQLWGFISGFRHRGLQYTEEVLTEGTIITGVGELSRSASDPNSLTLQPPENGTPFYLTSMSISSLIKKLDDHKRTYRWLCMMFAVVGIIFGGAIIKRSWKAREEERIARESWRSREIARRERRRKVRDKDLREDQLCVVCRTNPREIIVLSCGHVCICEDCADDINDFCPVCRAPIVEKTIAYII